MRGDPIGERLGPGGLGVGVARCAEDGDEHLRCAHLTGGTVDDGGGVSAVVDEELLTRSVRLAHDGVDVLGPGPVALAELRVLQTLGLFGLVLLSQQRERHALAPELGVDLRPLTQRTRDVGRLGRREELRFQGPLAQALRQGPGESGELGPVDVVSDGRGRGLDGAQWRESSCGRRNIVAEPEIVYAWTTS